MKSLLGWGLSFMTHLCPVFELLLSAEWGGFFCIENHMQGFVLPYPLLFISIHLYNTKGDLSIMKHLKKLTLLLTLTMLVSVFAGCSGQQPAGQSGTASKGTSITVTDMTGKEITLEEPATRIVALTASDCEILYAIGAGDTLVGRGEYCDYPAEVLDVPAVQSGADTHLEQIISLEPQVLLMSTMAQTEEQIAALEAAGIKVVVSDAQDIEGVYTAVELIGALMGKDAEAAAVVENMKSTFETISSQAAGDGTKSVYFEVSPLEYGLWAAGKNTFMHEIAEMLGLKNAFEDVEGWGEISEEQIIERNPDYIVTITMYFGEGPTPEEEIAGRAGWENITAVKNGAILNLQNNELSRPAPRLADGAQMMFDFVYGSAE